MSNNKEVSKELINMLYEEGIITEETTDVQFKQGVNDLVELLIEEKDSLAKDK